MNTILQISNKHLHWLQTENMNETVGYGTPCYSTTRACVVASMIGYMGNYKACLKKEGQKPIFFMNGKLVA
jgi:hypothetical protein